MVQRALGRSRFQQQIESTLDRCMETRGGQAFPTRGKEQSLPTRKPTTFAMSRDARYRLIRSECLSDNGGLLLEVRAIGAVAMRPHQGAATNPGAVAIHHSERAIQALDVCTETSSAKPTSVAGWSVPSARLSKRARESRNGYMTR
jgi:hypothetical protein